jgi:uncharacterized protein
LGVLTSILPDRLPWYVAGPALGALVVGLFVLANQPLGASGAYLQTVKAIRRDRSAVVWRAFYFVGIALGGLLAAVLSDGPVGRAGYETLRAEWPMAVVIVVVFAAAVLMGYGARMSGGCTSGHGICGTAQRSPASWAATATFMASAVAVTAVLHWTVGGAL